MTSIVDTRSLVARTEQVGPPDDLVASLGPDGFAWLPSEGTRFVTEGVAAVVDRDDAVRLLAGIDRHGPTLPGPIGPIAVGALGFSSPGPLVVPARVLAVDEHGAAWTTTVGPRGAPVAPASARARPATSPRRYRIDTVQDRAVWSSAVERALRLVAAGTLTKVVLAREVIVEADVPFDRPEVLHRLRDHQPGCTVFADRGFVGASPELLVRRHGPEIVSRPMAGTVARGTSRTDDDAAAACLARSEKDVHEHAVVVDAVVDTLRALCRDVTASPTAPVRLATVTHLATEVRARADDVDVLTLVAALHPTPAVGGAPRDAARAAIALLEDFDRGGYAGPVGWVDGSGDGEFVVGLRSATLDGTTARLLAGAGIVAGSNPADEWDETSAKLEPMLRALVRP